MLLSHKEGSGHSIAQLYWPGDAANLKFKWLQSQNDSALKSRVAGQEGGQNQSTASPGEAVARGVFAQGQVSIVLDKTYHSSRTTHSDS